MKNNVQKAALTGGIVWGATMFLTTLASIYAGGYGKGLLDIMSSIYPGYNISVGGSIIGFVYGFFDVFVGIYIIAWVYKKLGQ
jgi:hypothetical protein